MMDRQGMARWTANALDVRCGATAGGCLGMMVGALLGAIIGAAVHPILALATIPLGAAIGLFVGMRLVLAAMSR